MEILGWLIVGAVIGGALGAWKNRITFGVMVGGLIGPLGWLLILILPNNHPKCPACKGT